MHDEAMLQAAWTSLRIAALSATAATVLGTLAAVALARFGRFRGRMLFSGMVYAPLVMPEVITGLSLLLLFVALNVDRGFWTIVAAHTTLTMCFVAVIVQSRLIGFDRSLEEAAMDLGCPPFKTFLTVTLPLIMPAIAAGWMLAFSLSLDDLVVASFTTGPGAITLPIRIYSQVRLGVKPEINAVCTIMIAVVARGHHRRFAHRQARRVAARGCRLRRPNVVGLLAAALTGRAKQIDQEPDRHDHRRAEQQIRPGPSKAFARIILDALGREPRRAHYLLGGDAEMGQDRSQHQRGEGDLDQSPQDRMQHPRFLAGPRTGK